MAFSRKALLGLVCLASLVLAGLVGVWSYRLTIARSYLDSYFAQKGVAASYEIKAIEVRRQRLEHLRIGPAASPDLIADWVEVDIGPGLSGMTVTAVRAGGVRIKARYGAEKITLGAVDRLLPPPSNAPFRLPDLDVALEDARARLDTPFGAIGFRLDGQGNLQSGFEGKLAALAPRLTLSNCAAEQATLYGDLSVVGRRPTLSAPLRVAQLACPKLSATQFSMTQGVAHLDASIAEDGSDWKGQAKLTLAGFAAGAWRTAPVAAQVQFKGGAPQTTLRFAATIGRVDQASRAYAADVRLTGNGLLGQRGILAQGDVSARQLWAGPQILSGERRLVDLGRAAVIGPAAQQLARAMAQLHKGAQGRAGFSISHVDGETGFALSDLQVSSGSGARVTWAGKDRLGWGAEGWTLTGRAQFGGGGFPAGEAEFGGKTGLVTLAPYVARGARVAVSPVRLRLTNLGLGLATKVSLDGPIPSGRVRQLSFPITLSPGATRPSGCFPVRVQAASAGPVRIGPSAVQTCLDGSTLRFSAPRLAGRISGDPFQLSALRADVHLAEGRFSVIDGVFGVAGAQMGADLRLSGLNGGATATGWAGRLSGLSGSLGTVPLQLQDGQGDWHFNKGALRFEGQAQVKDASPEPKFLPIRADQIQMGLRDGRLSGTALLRTLASGAELSRLTLRHDLGSGDGHALLDVAGLVFGDQVQPEDITPVTLGVVANVRGAISGQGHIQWTRQGVTSQGRFASDGLDFAAAFGPVAGMAGEIAFADLLHLVTQGDQELRIAAINPGVIVGDGHVRYRILPGNQVEILSARWPFAGGALVLEPTVLDLSEAAVRRLTFRVEALDAARFIAAMGFENIAATGVYDGVLPMVFDQQGGRIIGGRLVARGGGTVSYVGPVSNENLGMMGKFAFDALKSMRYERLSIDLDGAIDGDVITRISFAGVNQAPVAGGRSRLPVKVLGASNLPFIFNVTISAKFRQLFDMAKSFNDPSVLINRFLPGLEPLPKTVPPVQPVDSPPQR